MQINRLNVPEAHAKGAFCHLKNPFTKKHMYIGPPKFVDSVSGNLIELASGKEYSEDMFGDHLSNKKTLIRPVGCMVLGIESEPVSNALEALKRKQATMEERGQSIDKETAGKSTVIAMVASYVNLFEGDRPLEAPKDSKMFFDLADDFVGQVFDFGRKNNSFFASG